MFKVTICDIGKMNINMTDKIEKRRQPLQYRTMAMTTTIMSMVRASAAMTAAWNLRRHELCRELQRITSKRATHTRRCSSTTTQTIWVAVVTSPTLTARWCSILSMCLSVKSLLRNATTFGITPYLFNAKEFDEETGMYYYGARYYDPRVSLWISTDVAQGKYPNVSTYTYCLDNPIILIDSDGKDILPVLFQTINNRGSVIGSYYRSNKKYMTAMRMFGQTSYGRQFIGAFIEKNQTQYGVRGNGKYSKYRLQIKEYDLSDAHDQFLCMPNIEGAFSAEEIEGKLNIILKLDVKNQSANELAETIAHELALHGSDLDKIIKTYEKDGIEAVKKLFASDPDGDMDHKSLAKQDKKHTGVSNYNQVKREMIKKYPSTKKVFDSEQKKYEKEFGN